jgi:hypothetical protein
MRAQLEHLSEVALLPNVTLRILPFIGHHPVGVGSFILLKFAPVYDITFHDVVYMGQLTGSLYLEEERDTYRYAQSFEQLVAQALGSEESLELIARTTEQIWH